ncbi:MAG TPA: peptide deformylase [Erysipelotrichaceae bacterium]|nr:peptide deformylase [Erysipelotrichaceae bacterium]
MLINNDTILKDDDPFIRHESVPVELPLSAEDEALLRDMFQYVVDSTDEEKAEKYNLRPAVGISAIQVGVPKQLTAVVVDETDKHGNPVRYEYMLANPRIVSSSVQKAYLSGGEGCLSVTEEYKGYIVRSARIKVKAFDLITNKNIEIRARGYLAIVLQHELDHFKGILFYDHINKEDPFAHPEDAIEI